MLMFVIQHQPHRAGTDLRRELVACLLAHGSTFSRVGASGKPGAVHTSARRCDNVLGWIGPVGVLAMNSVHHGWFFNNKEWIEFIVLTVVLWLLMMTAVSVFDLRSAG